MNSNKRKNIIILILAILVLVSFILFILSIKKDYYYFSEKLSSSSLFTKNEFNHRLAVLNTEIHRWLLEWNLTRNCYYELYGDRSLFEQYCQNRSLEPLLFQREKPCYEQTAFDWKKSPILMNGENNLIMMEQKFWLKFYIEQLPLWRARRFREWQLAKKWASKHGLRCVINNNNNTNNKINEDDNGEHKNQDENKMNQNPDTDEKIIS